jgi:hypothetical protein
MLHLWNHWYVRIFFEPRDIWIGVYWNFMPKTKGAFISHRDIYVCLIPCLPIQFMYRIQ